MNLHRRICPICQNKFDPTQAHQICCTPTCSNVRRVRLFRARKRFGGDDGGGGRHRAPQLGLFPKLAKAKPPKPARVPAPRLFPEDEGGLIATFGGAVTYGQDGSVSDNSKYSVKPATAVFDSPAHLVAA